MKKLLFIMLVLIFILSSCTATTKTQPDNSISNIEQQIKDLKNEVEELKSSYNKILEEINHEKNADIHSELHALEDRIKELDQLIKGNFDNTSSNNRPLKLKLVVNNDKIYDQSVIATVTIEDASGKTNLDFLVDFFIGDTFKFNMPLPTSYQVDETNGKPSIIFKYLVPYHGEDRYIVRVYDKISSHFNQAEFCFSDLGD